jgi:hypothetical protein
MCWIGIVRLLCKGLGIGSHATGLENVQIGTTATQIAGHGTQKLRLRGGWRFVQKAFETHDLPRGTKATLKGIGVDEGLLHRVEHAILGNAFNGGNVLAFAVNRQTQTGVDRTAVEEYGAGPAVPHVAHLFGTRQGEIVAQGIK